MNKVVLVQSLREREPHYYCYPAYLPPGPSSPHSNDDFCHVIKKLSEKVYLNPLNKKETIRLVLYKKKSSVLL